jgi:hydroxymethylpyrimidine/phosphomethylpyrimidine kinase / thiaminase
VRESTLHKQFCAQWNISANELENTTESSATIAYGGYLIDIGLQGDPRITGILKQVVDSLSTIR